MIEMPPLQFAQTNGIRMGYYEAGGGHGGVPVVLCHGWPEMAFSWRHQIKALAAAGIRVIAPDQRGYASTDRPDRRRTTHAASTAYAIHISDPLSPAVGSRLDAAAKSTFAQPSASAVENAVVATEPHVGMRARVKPSRSSHGHGW